MLSYSRLTFLDYATHLRIRRKKNTNYNDKKEWQKWLTRFFGRRQNKIPDDFCLRRKLLVFPLIRVNLTFNDEWTTNWATTCLSVCLSLRLMIEWKRETYRFFIGRIKNMGFFSFCTTQEVFVWLFVWCMVHTARRFWIFEKPRRDILYRNVTL